MGVSPVSSWSWDDIIVLAPDQHTCKARHKTLGIWAKRPKQVGKASGILLWVQELTTWDILLHSSVQCMTQLGSVYHSGQLHRPIDPRTPTRRRIYALSFHADPSLCCYVVEYALS